MMIIKDKIYNDILIEKLEKQLGVVYSKSAFYQKKYDSLKVKSKYITDIFEELPFTSKKELLKDQEENPPFGNHCIVQREKIRRIHKTSGTTDKPLIVALTDNDIKITVDVGKKCFICSGLTEKDVVVHCLSYNMWMGGYTDHQSLEATGAAVIPFGVGHTKKLIDTIILLKPTAIHCTPSYLSKIELVMKEEFNLTPRYLKLRLGLFGAESGLQNPEYRRNIEEVWGLKAMNANYGMADVLSMFGAECEYQNGLHFLGENVLYPELINSQTEDLLQIKKEAIGELVLTNLCREAQPLIRYRTNDIIKILSTGKCKCRRKGFLFEVVGRTDDMITIKGVNVFVSAIEKVISENLKFLTGVFQIHISKIDPVDRLIIKIELKRDSSLSHNTLMQGLLKEFEKRLDVKPEINFVNETKLPRSEGKSKKIFREL